jgi:DNA-directed RNA polymerase specialized sigma24 family protein
MSAALQLPGFFKAGIDQTAWREQRSRPRLPVAHNNIKIEEADHEELPISLAFYRRHTESMLRRYLYASMQVGRSPSILSEPIARGWASSRPVRTFEDAVIFVLDIEKCLDQLGTLDRQLLSRIVLQEYTHPETAALLGMSVRTVGNKFPQALDRLTQKLLNTGLLVLPPS